MTSPSSSPRPNLLLWGLLALIALITLFACGVMWVILFGEQGVLARSAPVPTTAALVIPTRPGTPAAAVPTAAPVLTAAAAATPAPASDDIPGLVPTVTLAGNRPISSPTPVTTATLPPGGSVTAFRTTRPFVIDGDVAEWGDFPSPASVFTVHTIAGWDGSDDVSAFWRLAWDDQFLWVMALVVDDMHVQTQSGNQIFRGDSLELQLDTRRDLYRDYHSPATFQIVLSPGDFAALPPSAFRFRGQESGQMRDAPGHNIAVAARKSADGYVLEAAIPWSDLAMQPQPGLILGVALNVNDNDTPGSARQEVMKSHISTRTFGNPRTWGTLILAQESR
jgi:hypothetical protein